MLLTILIFIILLGVLVLVHEWGHFITARLFGCGVEEFGIGFPPRAKKWLSKKTGIIYSLNWLPIGGFVKIKGEDGSERQDSDSFAAKPAYQRLIILLAGVAMNMLLAAVLLSVTFALGAPADLDNIPPGATVKNAAVIIAEVLPDSPASQAGFQAGDKLINLGNQNIDRVGQISSIAKFYDDQDIKAQVVRGDKIIELQVKPSYQDSVGAVGIGVGLMSSGTITYPWYQLPGRGLQATADLTTKILQAFATIIGSLFNGQSVDAQIAGPVGIAVLTGQVARLGLVYLLQFAALLSINLAIINVLPFPALDGGRVLFLAIEKIIRRPINQKIETVVHNIGFMILLALIAVITYRDLANFGGELWQKLFG